MEPTAAITTGIRKTFMFGGYATRSEFWWFAPLWLLGAYAFSSFLISYVTIDLGSYFSVKDQTLGPSFLLFALSVPALSAAIRRAYDANYDPSWVGWGASALLFGNGLIAIETSPANKTGQTWFTPVGTTFEIIGLLILIYVLSRPSSSIPNSHEVPS